MYLRYQNWINILRLSTGQFKKNLVSCEQESACKDLSVLSVTFENAKEDQGTMK